MFNRTLKDMNLHFRSIWDKICTNKHTHNNVTGRILVISMSRRVTNGPGLILVGDGGEHTLTHIFTWKEKKKINANFAFMHKIASQKC